MSEEHPIVSELRKVQYDLTGLKARVSEIQRQVAALGIKPPKHSVCPDCGCSFPGRNGLAEHAYHAHGGPVPGHWAQAEAQT